jgi:hypothetical protein
MNFQLMLKALAFLAICFWAGPLSAQTAPGPKAKIIFSDDTSIIIRGHHRNDEVRFLPVAVLAGERVTVQLRLPARFANTFLAVQPLDGGRASDDVVIQADGRATLAFEAGAQPGLYRLLLVTGDKSATLQFSVPNPANP